MRPRSLSLAELTERHRGEIVGYLARLLGDRQEAEDACQEAFLRAHRAFDRLGPDATSRAWLYRIATNTGLNAARRRSHRTARAVDVDPDALPAAAGPSLERREELRAVRRAVEALPPRQRAALMLRQFHDLGYAEIAATLGGVFVAASEAGLARVSFRQSEVSFVAELRQRLGDDVVRSPVRTADVVHQLRAYFAGERRRFDVRLDLRHTTPFQRRVLMAAARVPAGQVVSYGDIARRIGQPRGSRAVGQALGQNPIPIVIPCHRVVAAGERIGGYGGGLGIKRKLLRLEGSAAASW